eukprot:scaffold25756_cov66-Phaeocystis_antarctica.AAC.1
MRWQPRRHGPAPGPGGALGARRSRRRPRRLAAAPPAPRPWWPDRSSACCGARPPPAPASAASARPWPPDAVGPPKVRDASRGRDASTRHDHEVLRIPDQLDHAAQVGLEQPLGVVVLGQAAHTLVWVVLEAVRVASRHCSIAC